MRIAITDACIFIDLYELDLTASFFLLSLDLHTSLDVFNELYPHQQQLLKAYQSVNKLTVHNLSMQDRQQIANSPYPKSLSFNDKTVLYLAERLNAIVISSDKAVRNFAKTNRSKFMECCGSLTDSSKREFGTGRCIRQTNASYHDKFYLSEQCSADLRAA
ncbi:hypothetical protein ACQ86N_12975 [Puia sp. P3]|uniref:hypothetical protein n=1 Tax=Puia sp. P3 TaxID=3423952 RepID=UPI003D674937